MQELVDRANELRERFRTLEGCRGSGWHDDDRNPANPNLYIAPQKNGLPKASEHIICFFDDKDELVRFAGPDAERAIAVILQWFEANQNIDLISATGTDRKLLLKIIPRLKIENGILAVRLSEWNDVLSVFVESKVGLQGRSFVDDGSPLPGA